ncbi:UDP-N-acetyl-D-mannosamine dehydrogenase [Microbulbifer agarilyticus]|uniref:UDP-N-acetyl-D-mannosamine dehydrogenase n=1 Tax=Microbulbifer agarilyticus TaxID=260552 RepID=UPI001CD32845|nr:UDP-N-acetyl-D-mannosamine dehydrogenase [Microbulbifer agarilyticus]MCA0894475.1 UDP-N-acetyl-D-mannosamine dehydrogenase [Microbulbifer agarilyticus]
MQRRKSPFNRISVIGLGYIGLPTATVIASRGIDVVGVDVAAPAVEAVNAGKVHITEPGLERLVNHVVNAGRLRAVTCPEPADAFVIAVPTPFVEGTSSDVPAPDLSYIQAAAESIAPVLKRGDLVILESTSPVGTTEKLSGWLRDARSDLAFPVQGQPGTADVHIAYCPERILPGKALEELISNDRIIGGVSDACSQAALNLYHLFVEGDCIVTDARTAELSKLTENAYRDVNIAFANEMAFICDELGVDVWELIRLANRHPRVSILNPGPGVGGHCIAVDPWFIVSGAPQQAKLITQARKVNDARPAYVAEQVLLVSQNHTDPVIACLGLAFKPDIDDLRESPAMEVVRELSERCGSQLVAVEPHIDILPSDIASNGVSLSSLDEALARADIVVVLVDHSSFLAIDSNHLAGKTVIDTRGLLPRLKKQAESVDNYTTIAD